MSSHQFYILKRLNAFAIVFATLFISLLATSVNAQTDGNTPLNQPKLNMNGSTIIASPIDFSVTTPSIMLIDKSLRYGLKLRYLAMPHLALDASYSDLRASATHTAFYPYAAGSLNDADAQYLKPRAAARGYGLDLVGTLPIIERLSLTGRAGIQGVRNDIAFNGMDSATLGAPRSFSQARFGLGVQYLLTKSVGLRLEMERFYRLSGSTSGSAAGNAFNSDFSSDNISLGVQFKF